MRSDIYCVHGLNFTGCTDRIGQVATRYIYRDIVAFFIATTTKHCMRIGACVYTVKDGYVLGDNIQSKVLAFAFGLSAEIERDLIGQQAKEALARRRANGQRLGREKGSKNKSHKLDGQAENIKKMLDNKTPKTKIAKKMKVSVSCIYKYLANNNKQQSNRG